MIMSSQLVIGHEVSESTLLDSYFISWALINKTIPHIDVGPDFGHQINKSRNDSYNNEALRYRTLDLLQIESVGQSLPGMHLARNDAVRPYYPYIT